MWYPLTAHQAAPSSAVPPCAPRGNVQINSIVVFRPYEENFPKSCSVEVSRSLFTLVLVIAAGPRMATGLVYQSFYCCRRPSYSFHSAMGVLGLEASLRAESQLLH